LIIAEEQTPIFENSSSVNPDDKRELQRRRQRHIQFGNEKPSKLLLRKLRKRASLLTLKRKRLTS
jgi:hypothetical protein